MSGRRMAWALLSLLVGGCMPRTWRPPPVDASFRSPVGTPLRSVPAEDPTPRADALPPLEPSRRAQPDRSLTLDEVLTAVTERYPPYLSALLERDLASGRLRSAMGAFDTALVGKLGGDVQGYYEATKAEASIEQPLATGDTVYGGYRVSNGPLPDYDKARTQDGGAFFVGARFPLLRNRSIDRRRASVWQAQMDVALADPVIARARIDFVRAAARTYHGWVAAGARLVVARELLALAEARVQALQLGVVRQFIAPIDVTDNERLIATRRVGVVRAERQLQQAALELSLFLRDADDAPIVPDPTRLPTQDDRTAPPIADSLQEETERAVRQRPELRRLQLQIARTTTDLELADNATLPDLDLVVEAQRQSSDQPYADRSMDQLFVGGELKLPAQRREAKGRVEQARTQLSRLQLELGFARDRAVNDVADARSALRAAHEQTAATAAAVELAARMVAAEQRAFELGRSDLLRVQQRELQFAEARTQAIEALLDYHRAAADHRAALGGDGVVAAAGGR